METHLRVTTSERRKREWEIGGKGGGGKFYFFEGQAIASAAFPISRSSEKRRRGGKITIFGKGGKISATDFVAAN